MVSDIKSTSHSIVGLSSDALFVYKDYLDGIDGVGDLNCQISQYIRHPLLHFTYIAI
jgi:hypothetical protein